MEMKEQTISLVVNNRPDVLARVAGIFSGRGFNIENISANVMKRRDITKITIVTRGDKATVVKIEKQLKKLVDILSVTHVNGDKSAQRELLLLRIALNGEDRNGAVETIEKKKGRILVTGPDYCIAEFTGTTDEIDAVLAGFEETAVEDLSRSGMVAL